jgi:phosphatidylglycerophosphate synthase
MFRSANISASIEARSGGSNTALVETALIYAQGNEGQPVFGKPLLERNLELCARAGISRFFIVCEGAPRVTVEHALGSYRNRAEVVLIDSLDTETSHRIGLADSTPCVALAGNLVFTGDQLTRLIEQYGSGAHRAVRLASTGGDVSAGLAVGRLADLLDQSKVVGAAASLGGLLPFALDGRPEDRGEAECRIGMTLRDETAWKDGFLAHHLDRRISWRIALRLARTAITPNQVTVANTALGLVGAALIAMGGYWPPVIGALVLLVSVTFDGVDGELARMKLAQTDFGATLDAVTDAIVNFATFVAIAIAAYKTGGPLYLKLFALFIVGCALSGATAYWVAKTRAEDFRSLLEKHTSRDNVYGFLLFAILGRMDLLMWTAMLGSFVFPAVLWALALRGRRATSPIATQPVSSSAKRAQKS